MARRESKDLPTERTPLLPSSVAHTAPEARSNVTVSGAFHTPLDDAASGKSLDSEYPRRKRRWPTVIALIILCVACIGILLLGFFAPAAAERYAREAITLNVTSISVESFTSRGVQTRVKAKINVDASRVNNGLVRNLGRLSTAIVKGVSTDKGNVNVFLPDYNEELLGDASIPAMDIDVRNGHTNYYDFVSEVKPISLDTAQKVVADYLDGTLKSLKIMGSTRLGLRSGILPLGNQLFTETRKFEALPSLPHYSITNLEFYENEGTVGVNASAVVLNPYAIKLNLPLLSFQFGLPGCGQVPVPIATATTPEFLVRPRTELNITINGKVDALSDALTSVCPGTDRSPMDNFLDSYLHGNSSTVYVNGNGHQDNSEAPKWLSDFLKNITVPMPFPGHKFDNMVESIGLSRVKFKLPDNDAKPGTPEATPRLSAVVDATVTLPKEMKFPIDVQSLKAKANLSYHGEKFGEMHMTDWQPATSYITDEGKLAVRAEIFQAPLDITNYETFRMVVQRLLWGGGRGLVLGVDGIADVKMDTTLGVFAVRGIPAKGDVTIKALPLMPNFAPKATSMEVLSTTETSMTMQIDLLVENPTEYSAHIPYLSVHLEKDGFIVGNASISNTHIAPGENSLLVKATYAPIGEGRNATKHAVERGLQMLGEYVSGGNTTLTIRPHEASIPSLPDLSKALSIFSVTLPIPHLRPPPEQHDPDDGGDGDDNPDKDTDKDNQRQTFLVSAVMHIFSSKATFSLHNPFPRTPITIFTIDGKATYDGEKLGSVAYNDPWEILAGREVSDDEGGVSLSPRIPVDWKLGGAAYRAMVDALGGELRIDAAAEVEVGVGRWRGNVRFEAGGLKARVRL